MNYLLLLLLAISIHAAVAQDPATAKKLIVAGIAAHDKGDFTEAIANYDQALAVDHNNPAALAEKGMTLMAQKNTGAAIEACKLAIKAFPADPRTLTAYVTLGTAYDDEHQPKKAIQAYDNGIKIFPGYYQLHFKRAITLSNTGKITEAVASLERSLRLNPLHPGSHNAMARLELNLNEKIPALMAACRLLTIDPKGSKAKANIAIIQEIIKGDVTTGENGKLTITVSSDLLDAGKDDPYGFRLAELNLLMAAGLDSAGLSPREKMKVRLETVFKTLAETRSGKQGFFWDYYAPYFIEMNGNGFLDTFSWIALAGTDDPDVSTWLQLHPIELKEFSTWSNGFFWYAGSIKR